jgi:hypothetical protein
MPLTGISPGTSYFNLNIGDTADTAITAGFSDNSTEDVASLAGIISTNPLVATMNSAGTITTHSAGSTTIVISYQGKTAIITIHVPPSGGNNNVGGGTFTVTVPPKNIVNVKIDSLATASLDDVIVALIPPGSKDKPYKLEITRVDDDQKPITAGLTLVSDIFEVAKNVEGNFDNPISLMFWFDPANWGT